MLVASTRSILDTDRVKERLIVSLSQRALEKISRFRWRWSNEYSRIGASSIHGENLQFVVIHIGVISYLFNLRHGVSSAGEKAGDVDETIYARFTRNRASNLFQGPSQGIKLVTTRAHNFQNDKFIYRADNFRTPSIAIILNE